MSLLTQRATIPPNHNSGDALCQLTWTLFAISTVTICGRLVSKVFVLKRFGIDDVLMLLAWALTVVFSASIQLAYHSGMGRHYEYIDSLPKELQVLKWAYVAQTFSVAGPVLGRISFTLYLLSLIGKARHSLRYPLWGLFILQLVFNLALVLTLWGVCGFDVITLIMPATTCFKASPWSRLAQFVGALNALTDAALTLAPSLLISKLRTTTRAKAIAIALLSLSSLAMLASIWRTVEVDKVFAQNFDFTYATVPYFEASALEQNIIIITASIPTLGPIIKKLRGKYAQGSQSSTMDSGRRKMSGDSLEIQQNLARALGMHMPTLGNTTVITAGPLARINSEEHILPLATMNAIKTRTRTVVKSEYLDRGDEEAEKMFSMNK